MRPDPLPMRASRGFGLVAAMFLMIVVSLVIIAMSRLASVQHGSNALAIQQARAYQAARVGLASVQHGSNALAIQQARAYQAARVGLEWGISQSVNAGLCATGSPSLAGSGLSEFTVGVVCVASSYTDADGTPIQIFRFTATAQNGIPGARADYAFRRLTAVVER